MRLHGPVRKWRRFGLAVCTTLACSTPPTQTGAPKEQAPSPPAAAPEPGDTPSEAPPDEPVADPSPIAPTTPHPFSARDLLAMDRISGHAVSPDGKDVVFVRRVTDLAANKGRTDLWIVPTAGGEPRRLTRDPASDGEPRFSPDGETIYFVSSRSGTPQIWKVPRAGGEAVQVTDLPLPVGNLLLSPTGTHIAFTTEVFIDCADLACTKARLESDEKDPATGMVYDRLFVRHWDTWKDGRCSHLFVMPLDGGEPVDLTAGLDADVPSKPFGGPEELAFSPDGKTLVYTAKVAGREEPWSTNFDLFAVSIEGGEARNLTADNEAWDTHPVFSPDGKRLVWTAMKRPGYEADRFVLMSRTWPDGETIAVTEAWDRSVADVAFADDDHVLVTADDVGQRSLFSVNLETREVTKLLDEGTIAGPQRAGDVLVFARDDLHHPAELFTLPWPVPAAPTPTPTPLTRINAEKVEAAKMGAYEQFSFKGAGGDTVYGYVVEPVDRVEGERYPLAFLIHGGPQGSFGNHFHYRWNPQVYAGAGFAVVMIDFHGSTGYGQAFTDSIRDDWGGKPFVDLQKGLAEVGARYPFIDTDRACALGASYGGFMINWIAGKWPDGFRCLVNHDGVFDNRIMYYATEELWFPEWEHLAPYHDAPKAHEKHNPVLHVKNWKTPMLVIHGGLDYRVPPTQGLAAFTALQRRGVESRFLYFPDENHWVLAPANSLQWHDEVLGWLNRYLQK